MNALQTPARSRSLGEVLLRVLISLLVTAGVFLVLGLGFNFLKTSKLPQIVTALIAIVWGVGGLAALFVLFHWLIDQLPVRWSTRIMPWLFVGPAVLLVGWILVLPTLRTIFLSFFDASSKNFVGLENYVFSFTDDSMLESFLNNLIWMIFGTGLSVLLGLIIALLADRSRFESFFKSFIFLPMAISFVGAGVIWRFVYAYKPEGEAQIGLLNFITTSLGAAPMGWLTWSPLNTLFLVVILIWLQTGYAMVMFSSAIKNVPPELMEAARIDGADEFTIIRRIVIPSIMGTIVTVGTTILILTLKIFDIVFTMTGGRYGTEVIASQQYKQIFSFDNYGRGSAIAVVLLILVVPVIWYNLRQFRRQEGL